ncbi:MAG: ABC transporter ATP-binding protein [Methanomassiliicoccaceae archaeon]|jgi:NitT/TauT family transport system ATP-binding protein|nr:ABC transporter ATP-binding protein [Methanomassiliicoccaceae archaeon]
MSYIELNNIRKVFKKDDKETVAIDDISLHIEKEELVSILGPSGCGKTTVLRMIAGLVEPTSGEVFVDGTKVVAPGSDRGMVFQDFALFPWRSVRKNIEFGLEVNGVPKEERTARVDKYLEIVGLEKFADARVHELSGGMKQRVGIARALVNHPKVVLMDEPFGALDAQTRNIMQAGLIKILDKTDQTIVFVTHSVDEAVFLSDRIVILTKRPARIKDVIEIPWPRPRDRASPEFTALRKRILTELEQENVMDQGAPADKPPKLTGGLLNRIRHRDRPDSETGDK